MSRPSEASPQGCLDMAPVPPYLYSGGRSEPTAHPFPCQLTHKFCYRTGFGLQAPWRFSRLRVARLSRKTGNSATTKAGRDTHSDSAFSGGDVDQRTAGTQIEVQWPRSWISRSKLFMKKKRTKLANESDTPPCHNVGPLPFPLETLIDHRRFKRSSWKHLRNTRLLAILSSPLIYVCVLPFLLLDASVAMFQLVCFPIYGIPKVRRKDYLIFDRGRLAYLNTIEKVGCILLFLCQRIARPCY